MDSHNAPTQPQPAIRAFRICVDRPDRYQTILGVVRRAANDPAIVERSARRVQVVHRPASIIG
ncbi:MAG TPA: hypothetical protein VFV72_10030 [Candidatus Limnocylindrales bacterium]|nr:hypothetical protein [Candidatus Limnocylindrales bacterium]